MDFRAIASAVSKYAPLLASVISESNPIAGLIIMAIANKFNVSSNQSDILTALANPDAATKLKELELEHEDAINQNQVEDRKSAREREIEITKITGKRDWVLDFIAMIVMLGFFTLCIMNYFIELRDDGINMMLIGQLSSAFIMVLSFYFGSSSK